MKANLHTEYLFEDKPQKNMAQADYTCLDFVSSGSHIYGQILWPDDSYDSPRPVAIICHGYPGTSRNDDIAYALQRIGFVVLTPHHRGAWGSEGKYLVSNCVEDIVNLAEYVHSESFTQKYNTDPDSIVLIGHSMGGNNVINASAKLPFVKNIVGITPFNPGYYILNNEKDTLYDVLKDGYPLNSDGIDSILEDIRKNAAEYEFGASLSRIMDKNILIIVGEYDNIAPPENTVAGFWNNAIFSSDSSCVHSYLTLPSGHGLNSHRQAMISAIGEFANKCM